MNARRPGLVALLLVCMATAVAAHGAAPPPDYESRLLADHNDDCGGDSATGLNNCSGTHDIIALDVREIYDAELGDALVLRLIANGGEIGQNLKDIIRLKADGRDKTIELRTTDNKVFTGSGFDRVSGAMGVNDGTRFAVEATVALASLGIATGKDLSAFKVESYRGSTLGDFMPGGYQGPVGPVNDPNQGSGATNYVRPSYRVNGPVVYASLRVQGDAQTRGEEETLLDVQVSNDLSKSAQTLTISTRGDAQAHFHGPGGHGDASDRVTIDLQGKQSKSAILAVKGAGTLQVDLTTNLGGHREATLRLTHAVADAQTSSTPAGNSPTTAASSSSKPSPAPGIALLAVLAVAAATHRSTPRGPILPAEEARRALDLLQRPSSPAPSPPAPAVMPARRRRDAWVAGLMLAAGLLHLTVLQSHLQEALGLGLFFCTLGVAQAAWSVLYAIEPTRRAARIGFALLAVGPLALWAFTRVLRAPWSTGPEGYDLISLATVAIQVVVGVLLVPNLAGSTNAARPVRRATLAATSVLLAIGLLAGAAAYGSAIVAEETLPLLGEGQDHHGASTAAASDHGAEASHDSASETHPG